MKNIGHIFACAAALFASHAFARSDSPEATLDTYFREAIAGDAQQAAQLLYVNGKRLKLPGMNGRAAPPWDLFRLLQMGPYWTKGGFYEAYADYLQSSRGAGFAVDAIVVTDIEPLTASPVDWADAEEGDMVRATVHITGRIRDAAPETVIRTLALIRTKDGWRILQYI